MIKIILSTISILLFLFSCNLCYSQTEILEIKFDGKNIVFDTDVLKKAVKISEGNFIIGKKIKKDVERLKKFYADNGYFEAEVLYDTNKNKGTLVFQIDAKKVYIFDIVSFEGSNELLRKYKKPTGDYSRDTILKYTDNILDSLHNTGYMNARQSEKGGTLINIDTNNCKVNVTIYFDGTDKKYIFGELKIEMHDPTIFPKDVIRRAVTFNRGDTVSKRELIQSKNNINNYSIVESNEFRIQSIDSISDSSLPKVHFIDTVVLSKPVEVTASLKGLYKLNESYMGAGISYVNRNIWRSQGATFLLEADYLSNLGSVYFGTISAGLYAPYFINKDISLSDKLSLGYYKQPQDKYVSLSNTLELTCDFEKCLFTSASLGFIDDLIWTNRAPSPNVINFTGNSSPVHINYNSTIVVTLYDDMTNNKLYPSSGYSFSLTGGYSGLLPQLIYKISENPDFFYSKYITLNTVFKKYCNLSGKSLIASYIKIGNILEIKSDGKNVVPVSSLYKFVSGGGSSLRGWYFAQNGNVADPLNGGNFLFEGSIEFRLEPWRASSMNTNWGIAVFTDFGSIWESISKFRVKGIAIDAGIGVRYNLLSIPVRFDAGLKIYDPNASEVNRPLKDLVSLHFGITEAF